jgi:predicted nucleotidyltransferase
MRAGMVMDRLIEEHRDEIKHLARLRGARRVRVFGSRARGDALPESDVDILVDLEVGRSALALGGLLMDLQDLLGRKVDVVTPAALHPKIREHVLRQAVDL